MNIVKLREKPELKQAAANWFHEKWGIPLEAYLESMDECLEGSAPIPQWYIVMQQERIIAGLGVIENDFHDRKDLSPNVCAVYVEDEWRCRGIAGEMLDFVCRDMEALGLWGFPPSTWSRTTHPSTKGTAGSFYAWYREKGSRI